MLLKDRMNSAPQSKVGHYGFQISEFWPNFLFQIELDVNALNLDFVSLYLVKKKQQL